MNRWIVVAVLLLIGWTRDQTVFSYVVFSYDTVFERQMYVEFEKDVFRRNDIIYNPQYREYNFLVIRQEGRSYLIGYNGILNIDEDIAEVMDACFSPGEYIELWDRVK